MNQGIDFLTGRKKMRQLPNWLEAYKDYTRDTESAEIFNTWVGISAIASALRKKTWLELGRLKVFPNMYIVLVAEPGIARKSQAITYAADIMSDIPCIVMSADSITPQALIQDIEDATCYDNIPGYGTIRHASLSVISKEFEVFMKSFGRDMAKLTDLFDAGEKPWKHRTKNSGTSTIPSVFLNILGATTPQSLASSLSELVVGGGLASRILYVWSGTKTKKIAVPELTPDIMKLKEQLTKDLHRIALIAGSFHFSEKGLKYWKNWYESYDEVDENRLQKRKEFDGWYSRKPLLIQKVAIVLSSSESSDRILDTTHIVQAIKLVEELEVGMGNIFTPKEERIVEVDTTESDLLLSYIKQYKQIAEKHLLQLVWRDIDEDDFDKNMDVLLANGNCVRSFENPETKIEEIWYTYKETINES
jgi:hypothetical protein